MDLGIQTEALYISPDATLIFRTFFFTYNLLLIKLYEKLSEISFFS